MILHIAELIIFFIRISKRTEDAAPRPEWSNHHDDLCKRILPMIAAWPWGYILYSGIHVWWRRIYSLDVMNSKIRSNEFAKLFNDLVVNALLQLDRSFAMAVNSCSTWMIFDTPSSLSTPHTNSHIKNLLIITDFRAPVGLTVFWTVSPIVLERNVWHWQPHKNHGNGFPRLP